jgi:hypothetical protein
MKRPYTDEELHAYSIHHVSYEFDMLLGTARPLILKLPLEASTPDDLTRLQNIFIEAFGLHLRNVIEFFYAGPKDNNVVASDYFDSHEWKRERPPLRPDSLLRVAWDRADKELAHLTPDRKDPKERQPWTAAPLMRELRPLFKVFATQTVPERVHPTLREAILRGEEGVLRAKGSE